MKKILFTICFSSSIFFYSQKYACFQNDNDKTMQINVKFDNQENPISLKYLGRTEDILLKFKKKKVVKNEGRPSYYVFKTYDEIINGKKEGVYIFSNVGNYGIDITYKTVKNNEYYFQIIDNMMEQEGEIFRKSKCF